MMWKPLSFLVFSKPLSLIGQTNRSAKKLPCSRQEHEGWVDFYIGNAQASQIPRQSILDGSVKVGLHYHKGDLDHIALMHCPSPDIPDYLWRSLQEHSSL